MMAGDFPSAAATDLAVIQAFGEALAGTGKTLIGVGAKRTGDARRDAVIDANPRSAVTRAIDELTGRGIRTILVAIPPVTHSAQDRHGFIPLLIQIARHLGIPAVSIPPEQAAAHFAAFPFITMDVTMPSAETRRLLGWQPVHPGLLADLDQGHYFTTS
jgi:hypothetical protein